MGEVALRWVAVAPDVFARLRTIEDVLAMRPHTPEQWDAERDAGWPGSDGASGGAPDTMYFVRVAKTTADFSDLPFSGHDIDYRTIRRARALGLVDEETAERAREAADLRAFCSALKKVSREAWWGTRALARHRCFTYLEALIDAGGPAARPRLDEAYPR